MSNFREWVVQNIDWVLLSVAGLLLICLLMFIINIVRLNQLHKRYRTLMRGLKHENLEELLFRYADDVQRLESEAAGIQQRLAQHERQIELSAGPVIVKRYNAFPDAGSDLSFSVAFLNRDADGVIISSIFGREESRAYAKPILAGASTYSLSEEEREVLEKAIASFRTPDHKE